MSKRILALVTMVALVSIALAACGGGAEPAPAASQRPSPPVVPPANPPAVAPSNSPTGAGAAASGTAVTVSLQDPGGSGKYVFESSEFTFGAGENVSFTFISESEFHTFTVDDLGIDVSVDGGASETLTFAFDTPGEYRIICIPHEALGMVGTITVQ